MVDSFTTRRRVLKQGAGDNINLWGDRQSSGDFDVLDFALDGWTTKALTADYSLTTADGTTTANEAGARNLKFTGTGAYTVTIPSRELGYFIWNALTGDLTVTTGAGLTAVLKTGEIVPVICDASNVKRLTMLSMRSQRLQDVSDPTSAQDFATKAYADALAFTANAGILPGQVGNAGKFLKTDGTTASWAQPATTDLSDYSRPTPPPAMPSPSRWPSPSRSSPMAVTANSIVTPQGIKSASAVCTAAKTTLNDSTNAVKILTPGANGSVLYGLKALARATVTATQLQLYRSPDNGTTMYLIATRRDGRLHDGQHHGQRRLRLRLQRDEPAPRGLDGHPLGRRQRGARRRHRFRRPVRGPLVPKGIGQRQIAGRTGIARPADREPVSAQQVQDRRHLSQDGSPDRHDHRAGVRLHWRGVADRWGRLQHQRRRRRRAAVRRPTSAGSRSRTRLARMSSGPVPQPWRRAEALRCQFPARP
jgi:hypothetical protein